MQRQNVPWAILAGVVTVLVIGSGIKNTLTEKRQAAAPPETRAVAAATKGPDCAAVRREQDTINADVAKALKVIVYQDGEDRVLRPSDDEVRGVRSHLLDAHKRFTRLDGAACIADWTMVRHNSLLLVDSIADDLTGYLQTHDWQGAELRLLSDVKQVVKLWGTQTP